MRQIAVGGEDHHALVPLGLADLVHPHVDVLVKVSGKAQGGRAPLLQPLCHRDRQGSGEIPPGGGDELAHPAAGLLPLPGQQGGQGGGGQLEHGLGGHRRLIPIYQGGEHPGLGRPDGGCGGGGLLLQGGVLAFQVVELLGQLLRPQAVAIDIAPLEHGALQGAHLVLQLVIVPNPGGGVEGGDGLQDILVQLGGGVHAPAVGGVLQQLDLVGQGL